MKDEGSKTRLRLLDLIYCPRLVNNNNHTIHVTMLLYCACVLCSLYSRTQQYRYLRP